MWTRDALDFDDTSPQTNPDAPNDRSKNPFNIMIGITDMYPQSEDCLQVNVWTPGVDTAKRPVMVHENFDRPIMQRNYLRMIQDIDGLYNHVEEYLFEVRSILLDGSESDCLLVNTSANPRFSPKSYAEHVHYLTKRLLTVDLAGKWLGITSLTCTQVPRSWLPA